MKIFRLILGDQRTDRFAAPDDDDLAHAIVLMAEVAEETVYVWIRASAGPQCSLGTRLLAVPIGIITPR